MLVEQFFKTRENRANLKTFGASMPASFSTAVAMNWLMLVPSSF